MGPLVRLEGWEARLDALVDDVRDRQYVLGAHDCLRVACRAVEALTGRDLWPSLAGYHTRREALAVIGRYGRTLADAVDCVLGVSRDAPLMARRGDVVLYADREPHLGVCLGPYAVVTVEAGLQSVRLNHPGVICCWRVG